MNLRGLSANRRHIAILVVAVAAFIAALVRGTAQEGTPEETFFCVCLAFVCAMARIFATRRIALGLLLAGGIVLALHMISMIKMQYLQMPLFAPDLFYFGSGDTLDVIRHYPEISHAIGVRALLALAMIGTCIAWEKPFWSALRRQRRIALQCAAVFVSATVLWGLSAPGGPFKHIHARDPWAEITSSSPLTSFVLSLHRMRVILPEPDPLLADRYAWGEPSTADAQSAADVKRTLPDIVVVLEESTFDPAILADCTIAACASPLLDADAKTLAHGPLRVHTFGGGTWTSEFTLFTGLPTPLFGTSSIYAPFNLAPRAHYAFPQVLKQHGYRNIAVYPMPANFINARRAYGYYGFDVFHDSSEFPLAWESPDLAIEQEWEKIIRHERATSHQPLFVMLLTMRQHGPHNDPYEKLAKPFDRALFPQLDEKANLHLSNYLARMAGSVEAMTHLQAMLFEGDRPTILVHFGDHQPAFDGQMWALRNTSAAEKLGEPQTLTYYMI